jgi:uncharacterized protein YkwD
MKKQNKKTTRKVTSRHKFPKITHFASFLPALIIGVFSSYLWAQPYVSSLSRSDSQGVLAYATNISPSGLLSATNTRRINEGIDSLASDSQLASAAQAKANDMVARDYWSHVTPDGKQPWTFISAAGYQYSTAGENLAYGFLSSGDTITGWMNSSSHRANMLNDAFTEVGFGIANSPDYVGNGQQTVVVAMYAKPQSAVASVQSPAPTVQNKPTPKPVEKPKVQEPEVKIAPEPVEEEASQEDSDKEPIAVADTSIPPSTAAPAQVSRIQLLTGGGAIWSATFVALAVSAAGILWMIHKGFHFSRWMYRSERFVTHHLHLDLTVLSIIYLGFVLLTESGTIR